MTQWRWPHFTSKEMACPHCGETQMGDEFMDRLEAFRVALNNPMHINSAYRCPIHEEAIGASGANHPQGLAIDFWCDLPAMTVVEAAIAGGFSVGIKAHGPRRKRFYHIDLAHEAQTLWTYS